MTSPLRELTRRPFQFASLPALLALSWIAGCGTENVYVAPPPPTVTIAFPVQEEIVGANEYTGTSRAFESVEIHARVEGFLDSIDFRDGDEVEQGQLLARIDPRPFEAALVHAKANVELANAKLLSARAGLSQAKAELENEKAELARLESAVQRSPGSVAQSEIDLRRTAVMVAEAAVESADSVIASAEAEIAAAKAEVTKAELNLSYTEVRSPIAGRIRQKNFDVGSLVGRLGATLLTTVVSYDPIYVYFTLSETDFLRFNRERIADNRETVGSRNGQKEHLIFLALGDESDFPHEGICDYADTSIDETTGTFMVRGRFDNPQRLIPPGAFVRIQVPLEPKPALLVDETAVGRDQGGAYLLIVNDKDFVEMRRVQLGGKHNGRQIIRDGELQPYDRVITKGLQLARPGAEVTPISASDSSDAAGESGNS